VIIKFGSYVLKNWYIHEQFPIKIKEAWLRSHHEVDSFQSQHDIKDVVSLIFKRDPRFDPPFDSKKRKDYGKIKNENWPERQASEVTYTNTN